MNTHPQFDVVVVGYGPTGAMAANLFGASGQRVLVVEPSQKIFDVPRAVHFDGETMRLFQQLGLHQDILDVAREGQSITFTNGRNWPLLYQSLKDIPRIHSWANSYFFNQPQLESHLRRGVDRYANVEVRLGCKLTGVFESQESVTAVVDSGSGQEEITCRYLIGCDGASSFVRGHLNVEQQDLCCDEPWLVVDLELPEGVPVERSAYQICDPKRPTTLVPCEGRHIRWEFMVNPEDDWDTLESEQTVRALMAPHLHRLSKALRPDQGRLLRAKVYSFHALLASTFQHHRIFLAGDAAHQMPPFLGQGLCAGLRDISNLHWKLSGVLAGEFSAAVLDTYTIERRPHVLSTINTAVSIGGVIQNRSRVLSFFRDCLLLVGRAIPALTGAIRFDLAWPLGNGIFDHEPVENQKGPVGYPLTQTLVKSGDAMRLSDELLGAGFTVLGINCDPTFNGQVTDEDFSFIQVGDAGEWLDESGSLIRWAEQYGVAIAVVRPDRQVYGVISLKNASPAKLQEMLSYLNTQLRDANGVEK